MREYFILQQQNNLIQPFQIKCSGLKIDKKSSPCILFGKIDDNTSFPDLICERILSEDTYFASEALYDLFNSFMDDIEGLPVIFMDQANKQDRLYYKLTLENIYTINDLTVTRQNMILPIEDLIIDRFLFQIECNRNKYLIASLHVVENMLRKGLYGISYQQLNLNEQSYN